MTKPSNENHCKKHGINNCYDCDCHNKAVSRQHNNLNIPVTDAILKKNAEFNRNKPKSQAETAEPREWWIECWKEVPDDCLIHRRPVAKHDFPTVENAVTVRVIEKSYHEATVAKLEAEVAQYKELLKLAADCI